MYSRPASMRTPFSEFDLFSASRFESCAAVIFSTRTGGHRLEPRALFLADRHGPVTAVAAWRATAKEREQALPVCTRPISSYVDSNAQPRSQPWWRSSTSRVGWTHSGRPLGVVMNWSRGFGLRWSATCCSSSRGGHSLVPEPGWQVPLTEIVRSTTSLSNPSWAIDATS